MSVYATNGARLFIGGTLDYKATDFIAADYAAQIWTEIGDTEALGSVGDTANEITFDSIAGQRTVRLKGTRNAGAMEVVCGLNPADLGQIAAQAAERTHHDYAFRLVLNDAPMGGTPSERFFIAKIGSVAEVYDNANAVTKLNITLWVNSNVVKIDHAIAGSRPNNTVLPSITGIAEVGETLNALVGTWAGQAPITYTYQWFVGGEAVAGATSATYVPLVGDVGSPVSVLIIASNSAGIGQAISAATANVGA